MSAYVKTGKGESRDNKNGKSRVLLLLGVNVLELSAVDIVRAVF